MLPPPRRWDVYKDPFEDRAHFDGYIDATSGHLMWTAARLLGRAQEDVVRNFAYGVGLANLFCAIPELEARGRKPLLEGTPVAVKALAREGLDRIEAARAARRSVAKAAAPALAAGFVASRVLQQALLNPMDVAGGALELTPFAQSRRLLAVSLRGWWV